MLEKSENSGELDLNQFEGLEQVQVDNNNISTLKVNKLKRLQSLVIYEYIYK